MSGQIVLVGRLARDPELRFTPQGKAVCSMRVLTSRRVKDRQTNEWTDADVTGWDVTAWEQMAEACAEQFSKGSAVVVVGTASERAYTTREGEQRTTIEVKPDAIGLNLRWSHGVQRSSSDSATGGDPWASQPDPWAGA